jgi:hypothetical protein
VVSDTDRDPSTAMSAESDLVLPTGSTVAKAYLEVEAAGYNTGATLSSVKFKLPNAAPARP